MRVPRVKGPLPALMAVLAWAALFGPSLGTHIARSANPLVFNDDVRSQVWPFFRYYEGGFPSDYIGVYLLETFFPVGCRALFSSLPLSSIPPSRRRSHPICCS